VFVVGVDDALVEDDVAAADAGPAAERGQDAAAVGVAQHGAAGGRGFALQHCGLLNPQRRQDSVAHLHHGGGLRQKPCRRRAA
jgi:hypothetical protein